MPRTTIIRVFYGPPGHAPIEPRLETVPDGATAEWLYNRLVAESAPRYAGKPGIWHFVTAFGTDFSADLRPLENRAEFYFYFTAATVAA